MAKKRSPDAETVTLVAGSDATAAPAGAADAAVGGNTAVAGRPRRDGNRPIGQSSPWVPALMVTCFLLGLAWLVVYYLAGTQVPGMAALGNWNLLIGIGVIAVGFMVSTQWR